MGHTKRRIAKPAPQLRSRTTRSKGKPIVTDPEENSQLLNAQLRELGLYAAHTVGDGNCLFRALSDQLHGTPASHLKLRADICNWIERHKERYAPFVEDERGLDHHLSCMRQQGEYMRIPAEDSMSELSSVPSPEPTPPPEPPVMHLHSAGAAAGAVRVR